MIVFKIIESNKDSLKKTYDAAWIDNYWSREKHASMFELCSYENIFKKYSWKNEWIKKELLKERMIE